MSDGTLIASSKVAHVVRCMHMHMLYVAKVSAVIATKHSSGRSGLPGTAAEWVHTVHIMKGTDWAKNPAMS